MREFGGWVDLLFYGLIDRELKFGQVILKPALEPVRNRFPSLSFGTSPAGGVNRPSENASLMCKEPLKVRAEIVVKAESELTAHDLVRKQFVAFIDWFILVSGKHVAVPSVPGSVPQGAQWGIRGYPLLDMYQLDLYYDDYPDDILLLYENTQKLKAIDRELYHRFYRSCSLYRVAQNLLRDQEIGIALASLYFSLEATAKRVVRRRPGESDLIRLRRFVMGRGLKDKENLELLRKATIVRKKIVHEGAFVAEEESRKWSATNRQSSRSLTHRESCAYDIAYPLSKLTRRVLVQFVRKAF